MALVCPRVRGDKDQRRYPTLAARSALQVVQKTLVDFEFLFPEATERVPD